MFRGNQKRNEETHLKTPGGQVRRYLRVNTGHLLIRNQWKIDNRYPCEFFARRVPFCQPYMKVYVESARETATMKPNVSISQSRTADKPWVRPGSYTHIHPSGRIECQCGQKVAEKTMEEKGGVGKRKKTFKPQTLGYSSCDGGCGVESRRVTVGRP